MKNKKGLINSNKAHIKTKNKSALFITAVSFSAMLIGGIGAAIGSISTNNSLNNSISQFKNNDVTNVENDDTNFENVQIRTNPINGFESLELYDENNNLTGNNLVLISQPGTSGTIYGIASVDKNYNIISIWTIPEGPDYQLNYTTNIIPGPDINTFFVLAGINNIAQALNKVYVGYDPTKTDYSEVVTANLVDAPSIKIFKLHVVNGIITPNQTDPMYDFPYPNFDDEPTYNGGLKFFTKSGLFASNLLQQTNYGSNATFNSFGYLQYLFYGQLFQYKYANTSGDLDEFALISSYLGSDTSLGNLYAYYNNIHNAQVSSIGYIEYFYDEILVPMIKGAISTYKTTPYLVEDGVTRSSYSILKPNGEIALAPDEDQLTIPAAMSLAFMLDYKPDSAPPTNDNISIMSGGMTRPGHGSLNVVPGWFLFKPDISKNWVGYGFWSVNRNYAVGNSIWMTTVGTYYNKLEQKYYSLLARQVWTTNNSFDAYTIHSFDYFSINPTQYNSANIYISYADNNVIPFLGSTISRLWAKSPYLKLLDLTNNVFVFTTNTNQMGLAIDLKGQMVLTDSYYNLNNSMIKFAYDNETKILSVITNKNIYSFVFNWNNIVSDSWATDILSRQLIENVNYIYYIPTIPLLEPSYILNPGGQGKLNGFLININSDLPDSQIYSIQSTTLNNLGKVISSFSPKELGYQPLKDDSEFTQTEKNLSISTISSTYNSDQLKNLFVNSPRVDGLYSSIQTSFVVTKTSENDISINELIRYNNLNLIGFTIKKTDLSNVIAKNTANAWEANYENVFVISVEAIVWYVEPNTIVNDPVLNSSTVSDMNDMYVNDFDGFQNKYFNLIIQRIDNKDPNTTYLLRIYSFNVNANSISFQTVAVMPQGEVALTIGNTSQGNGSIFSYNNVFPSNLTDNTIMYLIIGITVAVALIIILGLAIGIPMRKNRKAVERQFKTSHKQIDTLTVAVGSVFKKLSTKLDKQQSSLLENKSSKMKPSSIKFSKPVDNIKKPTTPNSNIKPTYKAPPSNKFDKSYPPKGPTIK
ncbi:hypothetical protein [Mycoplasmoides pirum]|uniref:hypothetical protein n=1 Tax=Mycoplasmoides pirum TaxID=2122 RepID=UPI000486D8B0|nr:hypothetical protein [Mycoplasmoides pirum]